MKHKEMVYMTPMPVRIWHWLNAFGIVTLCATGLQIRFAWATETSLLLELRPEAWM